MIHVYTCCIGCSLLKSIEELDIIGSTSAGRKTSRKDLNRPTKGQVNAEMQGGLGVEKWQQK